MKKKIIITIFQPFVARTILHTGILTRLSNSGCDLVILAPKEKEVFYKKAYPNLNFYPVDTSTLNTGLVSRMKLFFEYAINTNIKSFHAQEAYSINHNMFLYLMRIIAMKTVGQSNALKNLLRRSLMTLSKRSNSGFEKILKNENFVAVSCDLYNESDFLFLLAAQKLKMKTIGMVRSWDNNVSKTLMPIVPDLVITQNKIMSDEVKDIQAIRTEVRPIGIPYYETYLKYKPISRDSFMKKIGIPTDANLILFSPAGKKFIEHDWQFCQILKEAFEHNRFPTNTYVLVRCHPNNTPDLSRFTPNDHFIIENPGQGMENTRYKDNELDLESIHHLIDSITHSSLVINILSSIIIDSAMLCTPVITPRFEGFMEAVPFLKSVKRFQIEENMETLLSIWNGSSPKNKEEFISEIERILSGNKSSDLEALGRIRDNYYGSAASSPSEELYSLIISSLENNTIRRV